MIAAAEESNSQMLPDEFEPVSEWAVKLSLYRAETTPLGKSSGVDQLEIGST